MLKICCVLAQLLLVNPLTFRPLRWWRITLPIRVQTALNHIPFVKLYAKVEIFANLAQVLGFCFVNNTRRFLFFFRNPRQHKYATIFTSLGIKLNDRSKPIMALITLKIEFSKTILDVWITFCEKKRTTTTKKRPLPISWSKTKPTKLMLLHFCSLVQNNRAN